MAPPQNSTLLNDDDFFELTSLDTSRYSPILPLKKDYDDYDEEYREYGRGGADVAYTNSRKSIHSTTHSLVCFIVDLFFISYDVTNAIIHKSIELSKK